MGRIADRVSEMRGCSLAQIVAEIARMEDGTLFALEPTAPPPESEFEREFWPCYPHKTGKPVALRAYIKARAQHSKEDIMRGLGRYLGSKPADRPWLNPSTFLNQARYLDQPAPQPQPKGLAAERARLQQEIAHGRDAGPQSPDSRDVGRLAHRSRLDDEGDRGRLL